MTAGMAGIIAAHKEHAVKMDHDCYLSVCTGCHWRKRHSGDSGHAAHVAEELAKAGYGLVPDVAPEYGAPFMGHGGLIAEPFGHGPVRDPNWWEQSTHMRLVGPWQELEPLPPTTAEELARAAGELQRLARWPKP